MRARLIALWICIGACGGSGDAVEVDAYAELLRARQSLAAVTVLADLAQPLAQQPGAGATISQLLEGYERRMPCVTADSVGGMARMSIVEPCAPQGRGLGGRFTLTQTKQDGAISQELLMDGVQQGGLSVDGQAEVSPQDQGLRLDATLVVTEAYLISEHLISASLLPDSEGLRLNGDAMLDDGHVARHLSYEGLVIGPGACHPSAGAVRVEAQGQPTVTLRYSVPGPEGHIVQVQVGARVPQSLSLPPCPFPEP